MTIVVYSDEPRGHGNTTKVKARLKQMAKSATLHLDLQMRITTAVTILLRTKRFRLI